MEFNRLSDLSVGMRFLDEKGRVYTIVKMRGENSFDAKYDGKKEKPFFFARSEMLRLSHKPA